MTGPAEARILPQSDVETVEKNAAFVATRQILGIDGIQDLSIHSNPEKRHSPLFLFGGKHGK